MVEAYINGTKIGQPADVVSLSVIAGPISAAHSPFSCPALVPRGAAIKCDVWGRDEYNNTATETPHSFAMTVTGGAAPPGYDSVPGSSWSSGQTAAAAALPPATTSRRLVASYTPPFATLFSSTYSVQLELGGLPLAGANPQNVTVARVPVSAGHSSASCGSDLLLRRRACRLYRPATLPCHSP